MQKKSLVWFWLLLLVGLVYRLSGSLWPQTAPDLSPLMAFAFVGAVYLPRGWNYLLVPLILLLTEVALLPLNQASEGHAFSAWVFIAMGYYVLVTACGTWLSARRSWLNFLGGTLLGSIGFYFLSNTFSWWDYQAQGSLPGYPLTLAGWWQANTTGLPGFLPTWCFLRNDCFGDLIFVTLLLWVWDRSLIGWRTPANVSVSRI